jgi:type IV pilus assembly protein PilQ
MTSLLALLTGTLLAMGGPVTEVAITPAAGQTSVRIAVDGNTQYRDFTMEGPNRLVVDLMGARQALPQNEYADVNRGGIVSIRSSQYSKDIVRVVFTLQKLVNYSIARDAKGLRITMENPQGSFAPWSSGGAQSQQATQTPPVVKAAAAKAPTDVEFNGRTDPLQSTARHISITFTNSPIQNVLMTFASFSGKSIIPGVNVGQAGLVTADIRDQPWDVALNQILAAHGLVATEDSYGIIRVDDIKNLNDREAIEPIETEAHQINYAKASEVQTAVQPLLTARGKVTVGTATNVLIVSDIQRVQDEVTRLLKQLDRRTPQVSIQTKIIFVNRTDLTEMGVSYELKDSRGNQLNQLSSGLTDKNGDGVLDPATETVPQGQATVLLGGNSIAALGDAFSRVANPTLTLLSSLVIGRHQLISFLDALASQNLSDVQATPQVTTLDNVQARMMVGQIIPVRVIEAGSGATGQGTFPRAQVTTEQTGIILQATPHVTADGNILMDISAERSSAEPASSDAGFIKNTQQASTRVLVRDGETVVFAGLTQNAKTDVRTGIPLLMNLPVIGRFFRHTTKQEVQQDLIILVTPHIVQSPS